jgi:hypothetical protein
MTAMNAEPIRKPWTQRLWLVASLLFMLAARQQPANRVANLSLAVVFGIFGIASARRR